MHNLPTLYKLTSTGAVQFWTIGVSHEADASYLVTRYGQLDTENPQETRDPIREGKNIGRSNATTREQQAEFEAQAKWEKQKKKGYVESVDAAKAGELDALIEGGIPPMLAHKFRDHANKIVLPCWAQPKLNGMRCIAEIANGVVSLWSRERRPILAVPHINRALAAEYPNQTMTLDGELYNHDLKSDFEKIISLVRKQKTPDPRAEIIQHHIYDTVMPLDYSERLDHLKRIVPNQHPLILVPAYLVHDNDEILERFSEFRALGYEGAMLRNCAGSYVHKRSYDLQKIKEFDDDEFPILGIKEGRGKLVGHVGAFICRAKGGEFDVKLSGDTGRLREFFNDPALWQGKQMTVRFQGYTAKSIPLFPVGVTIRDYE